MDEVIKDVNEGWDEEVTAGERASGLRTQCSVRRRQRLQLD